ncbi:MAG: hypothetical protein ACRDVE_17940, partial [Actinocrinis sp.]
IGRGRGGRRPVPLLAVIGGCGGAGASTLAVSLAVAALNTGRRVILFDADPLGGGLESLVALGTVAGPSGGPVQEQWPHDPEPARPALSRRNRRLEPDLALVTWEGHEGERIPVASMRDALRVLRSTTELVVVDLPRVIDDATQLVLSEATHTLVVAPVSERAVVATARLLPRLTMVGPRPQLVAWMPGRDDLTPREFAEILEAPLAGVIRPGRNRMPKRAPYLQLGGRSAASLASFSRRVIERCELGSAASDTVRMPRVTR